MNNTIKHIEPKNSKSFGISRFNCMWIISGLGRWSQSALNLSTCGRRRRVRFPPVPHCVLKVLISTSYTRLEHYIESVRMEAIGWTHADMCITLDRGDDPRLTEIPDLLERAAEDLDTLG